MKKIKLSHLHEKAGAKMVEFAGYYMPLQYEGVSAEHLHVRKKVGIFDVSHMGEFKVSGQDAEAFLQRITSNDVSKLYNGKVQYSCLPNNRNGIVDDLLVYRLSDKDYMLVVNAGNIEKDWNWINSQVENDAVVLTDVSSDMSLFAVQGPDAVHVLQKLTELDLQAMSYYSFEMAEFAGVKNIIVSATGYTGSGGFEIYVNNADAERVWNEIMKAGEEYEIKPIGLGARDTLRLEAGFALYGNDIDDSTSPIEAGLGWITKFSKDFVNSDYLKKQKEQGPKRRLVGFVMEDRGIPRKDYLIRNHAGEAIGEVTSGTQSPLTKKSIGMGYVQSDYAKPESEIYIEIRDKMLKAKVQKPPFFEG